ncbi:receptor-like protein EIX2 [Lolium rigidum]|uniref:receptor-like protein EIX2 n=1 Tax=Lolium rigidum TaxID=89674 RepID=UPI001F5E126F|nr:receptor-like protein EIX2 [Lolium rigidum]
MDMGTQRFGHFGAGWKQTKWHSHGRSSKRTTALRFLALDNTLLQIKISPNWIPQFKLQAIILASLQLGPAFPPWLRSQTSLQLIHISNASITEIPDWFWVAFSTAEFVDLSDNQIAGTLPATLEFMEADTMVLFNNRYTGTIPSSICSLSQLVVLDLSGNKLTGEVPSCEEDLNTHMQSLSVVNLNTNNLSGEFPRVLRSSRYLVFIDLSYNRFSGDLPMWLGVKLPYLALLRLRHNMFSGQIPVEIGMIQELQFLDLAHNNFSGIMLDSLVNMSAMAHISGYSYVLDKVITYFHGPHLYNSVYDLIYFTEQVSVLTKGQQLEFSRQIPYMVFLDLSCNSLAGVIPQGIGALIGLRGLNFSWNSLSGEIPENIGELKQLESLDLSNNELSGEIPSSMASITSLSHINLSYNTLSGKIPFGNQLRTFDASSYIGNIGLCGLPLTNSCPGNGLSPPAHADDGDGLEDISIYLGFAVGFVLGLWVIFCVMLFKRKWRISYFLLVERLQDKIYVTVVLRWANLKRKLVKT